MIREKIPFTTEIEIKTLSGDTFRLSNAKLFYHPKGVNGARMSHLDIHHSELFSFIELKRGGIYVKARRDGEWVEITVPNQNRGLIGIAGLRFLSPEFSGVFGEYEEWVWLGAKEGGLVVGVKRKQAKLLDSLAMSIAYVQAGYT